MSVAAGALTASAAHQRTSGGVVHVYLAGSPSSSSQTIVITGAFADAGRFAEAAPASKVTLSKGGFKVDDAKGAELESALFAHVSKLVDPKTCGLSVSYTAPATLEQGSGSYRGITGTVKITTTVARVFPRLPSGKCDLSNNAQPIGFLSLAFGTGRVAFN